jgi:hypothetical protein
MPHGTAFLIGQIKLTRIHVLELFLPGVRVKRTAEHLYTMSKDPAGGHPRMSRQPNLLSVCDVVLGSAGGARRDRTDDLMLAKHALSQLSYGPIPSR